MSTLPFPIRVLSNSRCIICNNYLTVAPIVSTRNGKFYKCGRCRNIKTSNIKIRLRILEQIAKHFTFPCIFLNCDEQLYFDEIRDHEKACEKRTIQCPIPTCSDNVMVSSIAAHFERKHTSSVCYDTLNAIPFSRRESYLILLIQGNSAFFIYLFLGIEKCSYAVLSLAPPCDTSFIFTIKLLEQNDVGLVLDEDKVKFFNEQEHCYKCLLKKCYLRYHKYSTHYRKTLKPENVLNKFSLEIVCGLFETETLTYSIRVHDPNQVELRGGLKSEKYIQNSNVLREHLECSICNTYMTSPIFICHIGHTICKTCKLRLTFCPTCRTEFATARVFALEEIAELSELLCRNEQNGCDFIGNGRDIQEHELNCTYAQ